MQEPTILEKLRQMSVIPVEAPITGYPDWFQEMYRKSPSTSFSGVFLQAADELEQMQKLNGRLLRRLADGEWIEESS